MSKSIFKNLCLAFLCLAFVSLGCKGSDGASGTSFPGPLPAAYVSADGIDGASAYDKWWDTKALGLGTQPTSSVNFKFMLCNACHGFDGKGISGASADSIGLSTGDPTLPDIANVNLRVSALTLTPQQLFDSIKNVGGRPVANIASNDHPDYSTVLTDTQIWNLVKFLREELEPTEDLYDLGITGILGPGAKTITVTTLTVPSGNTWTNGTIITGQTTGASGLLISGGGVGTTFTIANVTGTFQAETINDGATPTPNTLAATVPTINTSYVYTPTLSKTNLGQAGNAANGDTIFATTCATCHGADGKTIGLDGNFGVGHLLRNEPQEIWIKMKAGQPGSIMPQGLIKTKSDILDLYKALTNSTKYPD